MASYRLLTCVLALTFGCWGWTDQLSADQRVQIVSFTSERCEPCRAMQPALAKLAREGWDIRQVDVQQQMPLVESYKVQSLPTIVIVSGGRHVDRIVGALGYEKLKARFEAANSVQSQPVVPTQPLQLDAPQTVRGQSPSVDPASQFANIEPSRNPAGNELAFHQPALNQPFNNQPAFAPPAAPSRPQATLASATTARPNVDPVARAQRATVRIKVEDDNSIAYGTGTVINVHNEQALVLTCGHMFRGVSRNAQISVDVYDAGRPINVPAQVVSYEADKSDIGLMEFRLPIPIDPVPIARVAPAIEDPAFSFGCDRGADPSRRDTRVKRLNRFQGPDNLEIYGAPVVGRSGGGLFDARGNIIGVCYAADNEDDEGLYTALTVINQHLSNLKLDNLPTDEPQVQLASAQVPVSQAQGQPTAQSQPGYWPDEKFAATNANVVNSPATHVRCVIRDAQGKESMLMVERPSEELIALLHRESR